MAPWGVTSRPRVNHAIAVDLFSAKDPARWRGPVTDLPWPHQGEMGNSAWLLLYELVFCYLLKAEQLCFVPAVRKFFLINQRLCFLSFGLELKVSERVGNMVDLGLKYRRFYFHIMQMSILGNVRHSWPLAVCCNRAHPSGSCAVPRGDCGV